MRSRTMAALTTGALAAALVLPITTAAAAPADLRISELRIDQPGADDDEFFELTGTPGGDLTGVTYLVIGDGAGGSGVIESVTDLSGQRLGDNGFFLAADGTFSLGAVNLTAPLNFENSDNVTHLIVEGFTGTDDLDLDTDDDGTLDTTPWDSVIDAVGLFEGPASGEFAYGAALGFDDIGPDGSFVPAHVYRDGDGQWQIGDFGGADDTPTAGTTGGTGPVPLDDVLISEIRIDQPSSDVDEFFELTGTPRGDLSGVTYLVIGDGAGGSGVVESVTDLSGQQLGDNGSFVAAEGTFTLGVANLTAPLNFENSDNVTHVLVEGFTGADGDDLDSDDDGVLDTTPWTSVLDAVGLVETIGSGDAYYGAALGGEDVGPDGSFVPASVQRDADGNWQIIGFFDLADNDPVTGTTTGGPPPLVCGENVLTPISEVQGSGDTSPLAGERVVVRGVVTLADADLNGLFLQDPVGDADDATSEALYVLLPGADAIAEGSVLEIEGEVADFGRTQLVDARTADCGETGEVPVTPLVLPLSNEAREPFENMLVTNDQDLQVSGLFASYANGELGLALDGPLAQPTSVFAPEDPAASELVAANEAAFLKVNDRDEQFSPFSPYPWELFDEGLSAGDTMLAGDVVGVLNFAGGNFRVEPLDDRFFPETQDTDTIQPVPALSDGNDVAAFNVLNFFNTFGDNDGLRGATNAEDFAVQTAKIVDAINTLDAAVLGLVEIENDYGALYDDDAPEASIVTLVNALNDDAGFVKWDFVAPAEEDLVEKEDVMVDDPDEADVTLLGLGTDAIANGIIFQPARAEVTGAAATLDIDALLEGDSENSRWPLAQTFNIEGPGPDVTVAVNHFKSKGSSCTDTAGPSFDFGDDVETELTGNCNLVREYAAQQLVEWLGTRPTGADHDRNLVVGDLNSYEEEGPITILEDAGYVDMVDVLGDDAFTYKFDGRYGRLDYVLASAAAVKFVTGTEVWQINSRAPYGYLYDNDPVDETFYASSDHDPVVVSIGAPGQNTRQGPPADRGNGRR